MKKCKRLSLSAVAGCLTWLWVAGIVVSVPVATAADVQSRVDTEEASVETVFSVVDGDHRFIAYQVTWKGAEIIVSDPLSRSDYKVGDTIRFLAQRTSVAMPLRVSSLTFTLIDAPAMAADGGTVSTAERDRLMKIIQGDLDAATNADERFWALTKAARKALRAGETEVARTLATELEGSVATHRDDWNYGNAVQGANQVLGQIALGEGDVEEAKKRLLASADSKGSPQMNSFGPNMQLAKDLLERGEKEVVLEYFERCGAFWKMGEDRLAAWSVDVEEGRIPAFGANLDY